MTTIGVRTLKAKTAEVLRRVSEEREEVIVTRHGKPQARILPVDDAEKKPGKWLRGAYRAFPDLIEDDFREAKGMCRRATE